ncbi:hypothetical protein HZ326_25237 [Fusarium oxysporum f. sp. albedinis]|nr:hypothetical protein HZ326_25237 [Fusarium oxysporum f. sp. albedinis]
MGEFYWLDDLRVTIRWQFGKFSICSFLITSPLYNYLKPPRQRRLHGLPACVPQSILPPPNLISHLLPSPLPRSHPQQHLPFQLLRLALK